MSITFTVDITLETDSLSEAYHILRDEVFQTIDQTSVDCSWETHEEYMENGEYGDPDQLDRVLISEFNGPDPYQETLELVQVLESIRHPTR